MDVVGVALATIISQFIAMIMVIIDLVKINNDCKLSIKKLKISKNELTQILKIGLPSGIQSAMFNITNLIAQSYIISLGDTVVSGYTVANSVGGFVFNISMAVSQAITAFVAQNYGAGNISYIRKIQVFSTLLSVISTFIGSAILILLMQPIFSIYTNTADVMNGAKTTGFILFPFYAVWAFSEASTGMSKGLGSSVIPMLFTLLCTCVFRIIYFIFIFPLNHSYDLLLWVYPISWTMLAIVQIIWCQHVYKKTVKTFDATDKSIAS